MPVLDSEKRYPVQDYSFDVKYDVILDLEKGRIQRRAEFEIFNLGTLNFEFRIDVDLFDGVSRQKFFPHDEICKHGNTSRHDLSAQLIIYKPNLSIFERIDAPLLMHHGIVPWSSVFKLGPLRPGVAKNDFRLAESLPGAAGSQCVIDFVPEASKKLEQMQLTVDRNPGFTINRCSTYYKGRESHRIETQFEERDGGATPVRWKSIWFAHFEGGEAEITRVDDVALVSAEYNPPLNDELFHLTPSPGMIVWDDTTEERIYIEPAPGEARRSVADVHRERMAKSGSAK